MQDRIIPLTDDKGRLLVPAYETDEPLASSVVLTEGLHGTAWQRFFSDGKWHPTRGGRSKTWPELLAKRNVVLIYDAAPREDQQRRAV